MNKLRILIADDHEVVRRGVRALIENRPGWEVCEEASKGWEAVEKARRTKPDVAVVDIGMPELNGLDITRQIVAESPTTEVLVLTMHDSEQLAREVLQAGARGYVFKSDAGQNLVAGIEAVSHHKPFFTARVSEIVLEGYLKKGAVSEGETGSGGGRLTPRERQVLQLLAEGNGNKQIASTLGISVKTVEAHRSNIMAKLHLNSVPELVRYAIRNNIVNA